MLCHKGTENDLGRVGWVAEVKYDGTRALLIKSEDGFMIQNRRGINYTRRLPEITEEAENIPGTFILDGEICCFNSDGVSVFTPCQSYSAARGAAAHKTWAKSGI